VPHYPEQNGYPPEEYFAQELPEINENPFIFADYTPEQAEDIAAINYMLDEPPIPEAAASPQPAPPAPQTGDDRQTLAAMFILATGILLMAVAVAHRHKSLITSKLGRISYGRKRAKK
jgi:hypothetical protein